MRENQGEFLVEYIDEFEENNEFYILMEFCDKGDLRSYINKFKELGGIVDEEV
jgi:serine/threonine protein kinase